MRYHICTMWIRQGTVLIALSMLLGCGPNRYELYQRLPEQDKELFARSKQFMTDRQQKRFLTSKTSDVRVRFVESLHIHDRLKKFPSHERDAIMAGQLVAGMGAEAVLLSWGRPMKIDRREEDGVPLECWLFERSDEDGKIRDYKVYFVKGIVSEVSP